ncbi:MAG: 16S rRNA (cytosine(967)-C(5))-methyltransferase RsmB [bacterium]|nr:16S rRNA (cytosine(967)-C(5))-methyltransferase RsmB [bacterium]
MPMGTTASSARVVAADALTELEKTEEYADEVLSKYLGTSQLRGSDRALAADLYWGTIRWRGRLDSILTPVFHGDYRRADPVTRILLRMGAYQLYGQDRIPDHAAVSQTVELAIQRLGKKAGGLTNAILRRLARERDRWNTPPDGADDLARLSFLYSMPRWIVRELVERFGAEEAERALDVTNQRPPITVFLTDPTGADAFEADLDQHAVQWEHSLFLEGYYRLHAPSFPIVQPWLDEGRITVQDESAGLAAALLDPAPGDSVLDLCAAPGGKTLAILRKLGGTGMVTAVDVDGLRLTRLRENVARVAAQNVVIMEADATQFSDGQFDRVLTDVPCSATGLLRKQPDLRWRRKSHHIGLQHALQHEILDRAAELVKPGGVLVYSTCSILPSENVEIVQAFLKTHPDFLREDARGFLPETVVGEHGDLETFTHIHETDGAYATRLRRMSH